MTSRPLKILFDFDGTVCRHETIPYVASQLGLATCRDILALTDLALSASDGYEANLLRRVKMMSGVDPRRFAECLSEEMLRPGIAAFIRRHSGLCEIVSCNLDCWCIPLASTLGATCRFSEALIVDGQVAGVKKIANKALAVASLQAQGYRVAFVGDSANDLEAMALADEAILLAIDRESSLPGAKGAVTCSEEEALIMLNTIINRHQP
ncbi:MAG: HAD-IB family phosphatase [Pseudoflavonifractor sp.]|nr:HAD-IB family phosphatase [Alloprevotella sp.]MCM1117437.1 HAD-IB family phosphatase [Pseudoflavonifractor sp.]